MKIIELFKKEQEYWNNANRKLFGVELLDTSGSWQKMCTEINECTEKYWNSEKKCKLAVALDSDVFDRDVTKRVKNSYELNLNPISMCIDISAEYKVNDDIQRFKICSIPTPDKNLTWLINGAYYVPRVVAVRDYTTQVYKHSFELIKGEYWDYNFTKDEFICTNRLHPFDATIEEIFNNHLSKRSRALLQASLKDEELSIDNFKKAMSLLPKFDKDSIFNFKFMRMEYFEDLIFNSGKYAIPTKGNLFGINKMIASKRQVYTRNKEKFEGCLVASSSPVFALENFRTVANIYKPSADSSFAPPFAYSDTVGWFDAFKTTTTGNAGRQRMLLDEITVNDGMLWYGDKNFFDLMYNPPKINKLSCLSSAPFGHNNKAKRLMMNAKLSAQSVPLKDAEEFTNRIKARVGFTDLEGFNYADSIIISESFAKRLESKGTDVIHIPIDSEAYRKLYEDTWTLKDLKLYWPTTHEAILEYYKDYAVTDIEYISDNIARVYFEWTIPFMLGDKITNLHGAKGTVGRILPDEEMPRLMNKVGNMDAGPLEVIISGFSVLRRGSLGQIFEAWATASGIEFDESEEFISYAVEKYSEQMKEYSENSVVEYKGETNTIPVGLINMIRVHHHAATHLSVSDVRKLKLGEMEKLNLVSDSSYNILKELSIRSEQKHVNSHKLIKEMKETRELPESTRLSLSFVNLMKILGYNVKVDGKLVEKSEIFYDEEV